VENCGKLKKRPEGAELPQQKLSAKDTTRNQSQPQQATTARRRSAANGDEDAENANEPRATEKQTQQTKTKNTSE
jgi:hypothetical protein